MKRVLILGAGLVTGPMVKYLLDKGYQVTLASRTVAKAQAMLGDHPHGEAVAYDIEADPEGAALDELVARSDLAVSLLPYIYHVRVARACLAFRGKPMVTTSYVSPAMRELDAPAREAGLIILNEVGLDPGIDHMSAMQIIHRVQDAGGRVDGFMSYCGGLPAAEANDNPFGYKFSWSPRGVLLAARNAAHYLRDGKEVHVSGEKLFQHYWLLDVEGLGRFEAYPNRDSVPYRDTYGIGDTSTMYRGTLRYPGWCDTLDKIRRLGFLDEAERSLEGAPGGASSSEGVTYAQFMRGMAGKSAQEAPDARAAVADYLGIPVEDEFIQKLDWLGLFSDEPIQVSRGKSSPLDLLTGAMLKRMQYAPGQRDLVLLVHHFDASYPGGRKEHIVSTLEAYGVPGGYSAMARTVSLPAGIAADLILRGEITATGVQVPVTPELYEPILAGLKELGIECTETVETAG
jgi:saccharopine dehydrogenase-like NADP-dependent oxidoreductase